MPFILTQRKNGDPVMVKKCINQVTGENWIAYCGDCVDIVSELPDNSIGLSVFSPPFAELYAYSDSERDMGNSKNYEQFFDQFDYLIKELHRVMMPGRIVSVHCIDIPAMKERDGYIGIKDFPGDIIRSFQHAGFIYHSRHTIWKDPLTEATRTKALGLMHKQLCKDSTMCRSGLPDYIISFRKSGDNEKPISHDGGLTEYHGAATISGIGVKRSHNIWRAYASPVWMDIRQSNTLNKVEAREEKDQKHICPLQLDVIERIIALWSREGDIVLTPFGGIGSEAYVAVKNKRKAVLIELKEAYFRVAVKNITTAGKKAKGGYSLFS
jgi:DNA modification methylase